MGMVQHLRKQEEIKAPVRKLQKLMLETTRMAKRGQDNFSQRMCNHCSETCGFYHSVTKRYCTTMVQFLNMLQRSV